MKKGALLLSILFTLTVSTAAQNSDATLAVSPFNNITGEEELDYVAFQISEYLTTAYNSFPDITLVERSNLVDIIKEQKLQLSGVTDSGTAVELGELLNAQYMVLGSYSKSNGDLRVSARVTDVENGEVVTAEAVQGNKDNIFPILKGLFYKLVTGMKDSGRKTFSNWSITVPVEARVASMEDQGEQTSRQFAKALDASFRKNDEQALSLLQDTISGSNLNYSNYAGAAEQYLETYRKVQKIESETFFTRMLERQIDTNKLLLAEAEKATLYRNTLKILFQRMKKSLKPSMLKLEVGKAYEFSEGTVSMTIIPPSELRTYIGEEFKKSFRELVSEQDILRLNSAGTKLSYSKAPQIDKLMPTKNISSIFDFSLSANIDYAIQFLSPSGEVVYELDPGASATPFSVSDGEITWSQRHAEVFTETSPRPGWSYREGKVEVQARELQNLSDVRVVLEPDSFEVSGSFPMEQDQVWKSLIMHSYRQKYVKIAGGEKDPVPQVKEIEVTDYMLTFPDYGVDNVPLLVKSRPLARFSDITGVVYWADSSHTIVDGLWSGAVSGRSPTVKGEFTPKSVLYFGVESSPKDIWSIGVDDASFTVVNEGQQKKVDFRVGPAMAMFYEDDGPYRLLRTETGLFGTGDNGTYRYEPETGRILWRNDQEGRELTSDGRYIFTTDSTDEGTACIDIETGNTVWKNSDIWGYDIVESGNQLFVSYNRRNSHTSNLDKNTGNVLWKTDSGSSSIILAADKVFNGKSFIHRTTGEELEDFYRADADDLLVAGGIVFYTGGRGTYAYDPVSMKKKWENDTDGSALIHEGGRLYITHKYRSFCLDTKSGKTIWKNEDAEGNRITSFGDTLYITGDDDLFAVNKVTGKMVWRGNFDGSDSLASDGLVYVSNHESEFWAFDPHAFFRDTEEPVEPKSYLSRAESLTVYKNIKSISSTSGTLKKEGETWFRLSVPEALLPAEAVIETSGSTDTEMEIRSPSNFTIAENSDSGEDDNAKVRFAVFEGRDLFVRITGDRRSSSGSFVLSGDLTSINADYKEPDNHYREAKTYSGGRQRRTFHGLYDKDWIRFVPETGGTFTFSTSGDLDTWGVLYRADASRSGGLDKLEDDDYDGPGSNFFIREDLNAGSTYYIRIRPDQREYRRNEEKLEGKSYYFTVQKEH